MKNKFQIQVSKKRRTLKAVNLVIYKQSKIIEATDSKGNCYYLVFYKDKYINGKLATFIRLHSHIHHAYKDGIVFNGDHPFINQLLQKQQVFHFHKFNQLYPNLLKSYSKIDALFILQFFNTFTKEKSIEKLFKRLYYELRRDGKIYQSFRLLKSYLNYYPHDSFAREMIIDIGYQSYKERYQDIFRISEKDPTYTELFCFDQRTDPKYQALLLKLLKKEDRWIDALALRIDSLRTSYSEDHFIPLVEQITIFPLEEQQLILQDITKENHHPIIQEQLFQILIKQGNANHISTFLLTTDYIPKKDQVEQIITCFKQADMSVLCKNFATSNKRLLVISDGDNKCLERIVFPFVSAFLQQYSLEKIIDWFQPFHQENISLPIEQKLVKMKKLANDPDRQLILGELYLDFHQLEKSVDCFLWEMELHPTDPKPIRYLSNVYKRMGRKEEASAYQQLLVQMER